ncbi:MAG: glycyl-radical enzyme activating protein [Mangrovibacterium sp.]
MNGIVFDIKRFAVHDGPGIRTTVFLKGCPLHCLWCHNPEGIDPKPVSLPKTIKLNGRKFTEELMTGYEITQEALFAELQKEQLFMEESGGGVTFSGGEPLLQHVFLTEMLRICQHAGMHTATDTSFLAPWKVIRTTAQWTSLFLIDLKLMDSQEHFRYTGVSNELILQNIRRIASTGHPFRIRIPMIPGISTKQENIRQCIAYLKNLANAPERIDLLPFHSTARQKYRRLRMENRFEQFRSMKKEELSGIKEQFEQAGFFVK